MYHALLSPDDLRHRFSAALSAMCLAKVPACGDLMALVADIKSDVPNADFDLRGASTARDELDRSGAESYVPILLGQQFALATMRSLPAAMGWGGR